MFPEDYNDYGRAHKVPSELLLVFVAKLAKESYGSAALTIDPSDAEAVMARAATLGMSWRDKAIVGNGEMDVVVQTEPDRFAIMRWQFSNWVTLAEVMLK